MPLGAPNCTAPFLFFSALIVVDTVRSPSEPSSIQAIGWRANKVAFIPTPVSRQVEVVINSNCEQDRTLGASQNNSLSDIEGKLCEKSVRRPALDDDVENVVEPPTQLP